MSSPIRVLLADDHPLIRTGVRSVLEEEPDIVIVGEAQSSGELHPLCQQAQPDVVLLDLQMPNSSPAQTIEQLRTSHPDVRILLLTAYNDDIYVRLAARTRVNGYILKDEMPEVVVTAIRTVMNGGFWYSHTIASKLSKLMSYSQKEDCPTFTPREKEVLELLAQGHTNEQIAEVLGLSYQTVRNYVSRLYSKLGVHSRTEAVMWAQRYQQTHR